MRTVCAIVLLASRGAALAQAPAARARRSVHRQRLARLLGDERQHREHERQRILRSHLGSRRPVEARLDGARDQRAHGRRDDGRVLLGELQSDSAISRRRAISSSPAIGARTSSRATTGKSAKPSATAAGCSTRTRHMLALEGGGGAKQSDLIDGRRARRSDRARRARLSVPHHRQLGVQPEAPARARRRQPLHGIDVGAEGATSSATSRSCSPS